MNARGRSNRGNQPNRNTWFGMLVALLTMTGSVTAGSQTLDVPQPWIDYAHQVGRQFQASLETDNDAANQLHQFLEDRILNAKGDTPPPAIVVRAWIGANGAVTRVEFDTLGDAKADATLRQMLTAHPIAEPPPADMRQPLRVRLQMTATAAPASGTPATAP
ncbi:YbaB/EbfC family DNA-binding protein [Paraburkholderia acidicola]